MQFTASRTDWRKDAADESTYIKNKFVATVLQVAYWFEHSAVRCRDLGKEQEANGETLLKMVKMLSTRWLSSDRAVQALSKSLASVIAVMQDPKRKREAGIGASKVLRSFKFVATLELFADTLPDLSRLSRVFQSRALDFSGIATAVTVVRDTLQAKADLASRILAARQAQAGAVKEAKAAARDGEEGGFQQILAPPVDVLMARIDSKLAELKERGIVIEKDTALMRDSFAKVRAQWLRALVDQLNRRFPPSQLFTDLSVLFDPLKLPGSVQAAALSNYGDDAAARMSTLLSVKRPALPPLAQQLEIVERKANVHQRAVQEAAAAQAAAEEQAAAAAAADSDADMEAADDEGDEGDEVKADAHAGGKRESKAEAPADGDAAMEEETDETIAAAYEDASFVDAVQLRAEWSAALRHLIVMRDSDELKLAAQGKSVRTAQLLRAFLQQPSSQKEFPETCKLMSYALTLPISTVECERGYSLMNLIKTLLRNRLGQERLQDLMRVALVGKGVTDKSIDWMAILQFWFAAKARKVNLVLTTAEPAAKSPAVPLVLDSSNEPDVAQMELEEML